MHVKISAKGRSVINNKCLASELVLAIADKKIPLVKGEIIKIGTNLEIRLVTAMK